MNIRHLKKQAKNLARLLPSHLKDHERYDSLSACQELVAKINGYPDWHTALSKHNDPKVSSQSGDLQGTFRTTEVFNPGLGKTQNSQEEDLERTQLERYVADEASWSGQDCLNVVKVAGVIQSAELITPSTVNPYIHILLQQTAKKEECLEIRFERRRLDDIVAKLKPGQLVYIKGFIGVGRESLNIGNHNHLVMKQFINAYDICAPFDKDIKVIPDWFHQYQQP